MAEQIFHCIKCIAEMKRGFMIDDARKHSSAAYMPGYWVEGEPEFNSFLGDVEVNVDTKKKYTVRSLRCGKCGFLELYAV